MSAEHPDTYTYRGRTLEELVPRIREDLGDDAVIVARREARTGGFAGFFARREIEVDVQPAATPVQTERPAMRDPDESPAARLFREQLQVAQERSAGHDVVSDDYAGPGGLGDTVSAGDVDVHDLFPASAAKAEYVEIFVPPPGAEKDWNAAGNADVIHLAQRKDWDPPSAEAGMQQYEDDLDAILVAPIAHDTVEAAPEAALPDVTLVDGPVTARRVSLPPSISATTTATGAGAAIAQKAAQRMIDRGLDADLAHRASAEAVMGLLPFSPDADVRELVARALAQHLPVAPLRTGAATVAFVGSGGSGKTRCVTRLAAAYGRASELAVTVIALNSLDDGEELTRLLAPYDVQLITAASGAAAAAELPSESRGMVFIDTPAIVLRDAAGRAALVADLAALAPDEVHVTLPATMSGDAARELLDALADLQPVGMTVTHCDETFQLGTMLGLSIERDLPISYLGHGQAVDSGLTAIAAEALAAELLC